jgi:hypothetical protein
VSLIETPNFSEMPIGKLREYASHLRVALAKTDTKEEIIEKLESKLSGKVIPELANSASKLKPGYARIRLHEDPMPGASNLPVYVNANGYVATIPRGVEVIVPMRVVRVLNDATVNRRRQQTSADANGREAFKETTVSVPSYPFQILELAPGPEVLTTLEMAKAKTIGPRKRYADMFGRWPKPAELTRAIEQKLISLNDDETLGSSEEQILSNKATQG